VNLKRLYPDPAEELSAVRKEVEAEEAEQYQFETSQSKYWVFVTDMHDPIYFVVWSYSQRAAPKTENLQMLRYRSANCQLNHAPVCGQFARSGVTSE